jgi:hypothetical protein
VDDEQLTVLLEKAAAVADDDPDPAPAEIERLVVAATGDGDRSGTPRADGRRADRAGTGRTRGPVRRLAASSGPPGCAGRSAPARTG